MASIVVLREYTVTKLHYPATERNRDAILAVLRDLLPLPCRILEVGSGSGEHGAYFAPRLPHVSWQPSDPDPDCCASIDSWRADAAGGTLLPALALDAGSADWPVKDLDVIFSANVIHISPWSVSEGLFAGAGRVLKPGGKLILYGPFFSSEIPTAPSNEAFDESLRARNPAWGIRDIADLHALARSNGLVAAEQIPMPANNMILVFSADAEDKRV